MSSFAAKPAGHGTDRDVVRGSRFLDFLLGGVSFRTTRVAPLSASLSSMTVCSAHLTLDVASREGVERLATGATTLGAVEREVIRPRADVAIFGRALGVGLW